MIAAAMADPLRPATGTTSADLADDLAAVTGHLDLKDVIHIGHSTGGGEVVHYLARHGEDPRGKGRHN